MDFDNCRFHIENMGALDDGFDYYAPQSFLDKAGNRVLIAWQNGWQWMPWHEGWGPTGSEGWRGTLSIPRVAVLNDKNQVCLRTVESFETLAVTDFCEENVAVSTEKYELHPTDPFSFQINITGNTDHIEAKNFEVISCGGNNKETVISIDFTSDIMMLDRSNSDHYSAGRAFCRFENITGKFTLQLLIDHSSVEAILNEKYCLTANIYPAKEQTESYIRTPYKNGIIDKVTVSSIRSIW
jgi:beta-fructofuranosidase